MFFRAHPPLPFPEVADIYLGEFMRMFDHYYFRSHTKAVKEARAKSKTGVAPKWAFLAPDGSWTDEFFAGGPKESRRLAFF